MMMALAMMSVRTTVMRRASEWEAILHEIKCSISVDISISLGIWSILVDNAKDCRWNLFWVLDLQEGVIVLLGLLAIGTIVKVFADTALVSDTDNRELATAIALTFLMDNLTILDVRLLLWSLWHVLEHLAGLLFKLFLNELLKCFLRHSVFLVFLVAFFLSVLQLRI